MPFRSECVSRYESQRSGSGNRSCTSSCLLPSEPRNEGCPVVSSESETACGEYNSLSIIKEFRQVYEDCIKNLEECENGTVVQVAPYKKIIEDLWEQNKMLVETVEELEQEATARVELLQDRLNKTNNQVAGKISHLEFANLEEVLQEKDRLIEELCLDLKSKECLMQTHLCKLEKIKNSMSRRGRKYKEKLTKLTEFAVKNNIQLTEFDDDCEDSDCEQLNEEDIQDVPDTMKKLEEALKEKQKVDVENNKIKQELNNQKSEVNQLQKQVELLTSERLALFQQLTELENNLKETRWALTAEVGEKHDQVLDLKRTVNALEEQLRKADMQTHFKDDIIKELRKDLKYSRRREPRGLFDVVTELKDTTRRKYDRCNSESSFRRYEERFTVDNFENMALETPQQRLEALSEALKNRMEQLNYQERTAKELELELDRTKHDLNKLQMKYRATDFSCGSSSVDELYKTSQNELNTEDLRMFLIKADTALSIVEELREKSADWKRVTDKYSCECCKQVEQDVCARLNDDLENEREKLRIEYNDTRTYLKQFIDYVKNRIKLSVDGSTQSEESFQVNEDCAQHNLLKQTLSELDEEFQQYENENEIINNLKDKLKGNKERIKHMEVEIADHLETRELAEKWKCESESTISNLSIEVKRLQDELVNCRKYTQVRPQSECLHDEKHREEIEVLHDKLLSQDKMLCNKEEMLKIVQDNLKKREHQYESLQRNVRDLEVELCEVRRLMEEKQEVIRHLQDALQHCKQQTQFEMKSKEEKMKKLKFELCGLEEQFLVFYNEAVVKDNEMELLKDENVNLRSQIFTLNQDLKIMEPQVMENQKKLLSSQEMVQVLEKTITDRELEMTGLLDKIKDLEAEVEFNSRKAAADDELIKLLKNKVKELQFKLINVKDCYVVALTNTEDKLMEERHLATLHQHECETMLQAFKAKVTKLKEFNEFLQQHVKGSDIQADILTKIDELSHFLRVTEDKRLKYDETILQLQNRLVAKEQQYQHEAMTLRQELDNEKYDNLRCKLILNKIKCSLSSNQTIDETLKEYVKELNRQINDFKNENSELKDLLLLRQQDVFDNNNDLVFIDGVVSRLRRQKNEVKNFCCALEADVFRERNIRQLAESRVEELHGDLSEKVIEYNELLQNQKELSCQLKQTINKLKVAEDELLRVKDELLSYKQQTTTNELVQDVRQIVDENNQILQDMLNKKTEELDNLLVQYKRLQEQLRCNADSGEKEKQLQSCVQEMEQKLRIANHRLQIMENNLKITCQNYSKCDESLVSAVEREAALQEEFTIREGEWSLKLKQISEEKNRLEDSANDLQNKVDDLYLQVDSRRNDWQTEVAKNRTMNQTYCVEIKSLRQELSNASKLLKAQAEVSVEENMIRNLQDSVSQLEQEVGESESEVKQLKYDLAAKTKLVEDLTCLKLEMEDELALIKQQNCGLHQEVENTFKNLDEINVKYIQTVDTLMVTKKEKEQVEELLMKTENDKEKMLKTLRVIETMMNKVELSNRKMKEKLSRSDITQRVMCLVDGVSELETARNNLCGNNNELKTKLKSYEALVPQLYSEIEDKTISMDSLTRDLELANMSCEQMRQESDRVLSSANKYIAEQKTITDKLRCNLKLANTENNNINNERRALSEQLVVATRMNQYLLNELQNQGSIEVDSGPRSCSPAPWHFETAEKDSSKPEFCAESGFHSMQPSPSDFVYDVKQITRDLRRTNSYYDVESDGYSASMTSNSK